MTALQRVGKAYLILGKLSVMHIFVPMLLDTAFCPCGERLSQSQSVPIRVTTSLQQACPYLGNLGPALAGISHLLQTQLLRRGPWRICAALLRRRARLYSGLGVDCRRRLRRGSYRSRRGRHRDWRRYGRSLLSRNLGGLGGSRDDGRLRRRSLGVGNGSSGGTATLSATGRRRGGGGRRLGSWLLLDRLVLDLLRLDGGRLALVLHIMLRDVMLLLNGLRLLRLLRDVLRMLLLHMLLGMLRVLLRMLSMLRVLGVRVLRVLLLLLGRVLRDWHGRLNCARMLLVVLLRGGLLSVLAIVEARVVAAIHVRLGLRVPVVLLLTVPGCVSSERRLVLRLHRHRGLRLRRP